MRRLTCLSESTPMTKVEWLKRQIEAASEGDPEFLSSIRDALIARIKAAGEQVTRVEFKRIVESFQPEDGPEFAEYMMLDTQLCYAADYSEAWSVAKPACLPEISVRTSMPASRFLPILCGWVVFLTGSRNPSETLRRKAGGEIAQDPALREAMVRLAPARGNVQWTLALEVLQTKRAIGCLQIALCHPHGDVQIGSLRAIRALAAKEAVPFVLLHAEHQR